MRTARTMSSILYAMFHSTMSCYHIPPKTLGMYQGASIEKHTLPANPKRQTAEHRVFFGVSNVVKEMKNYLVSFHRENQNAKKSTNKHSGRAAPIVARAPAAVARSGRASQFLCEVRPERRGDLNYGSRGRLQVPLLSQHATLERARGVHASHDGSDCARGLCKRVAADS